MLTDADRKNLMDAAGRGDVETVRRILPPWLGHDAGPTGLGVEAGANPNPSPTPCPNRKELDEAAQAALHKAAYFGKEALVR